jgi:hypothetical protein
MRARTLIPTAAVTLAAAAAAAGCASQHTPAPTPSQVATAYMRAHPQPAVPGTTTGIILTSEVRGFLGKAATEAGCPANLTAAITRAVGSLPGCGAWTATAVTPAGTIMTITCGSIPARQACPLMLRPNGYVPVPGDYVRFQPYVPVALMGNVQLITISAVDVPGGDPGGPEWVTTAA